MFNSPRSRLILGAWDLLRWGQGVNRPLTMIIGCVLLLDVFGGLSWQRRVPVAALPTKDA